MENQLIQPFVYSGQVTIFVINGKNTLYKYSSHNKGTKVLFEGLCNLLAGESYNSQKSKMPQFIKLYHSDRALTNAYKYNVNPQIKSSGSGNNQKFVTVFHFAIPSGQIEKTSDTINHLKLFGATQEGGAADEILATFDIPEDKAIAPTDLTTNTQYIVEWSLGFDNQADQDPVPAT